jgi:hypothetical protein
VVLATAVLVLAAESACPALDQDPGAEVLPVSLNAGPALVFGVHDGQLFAFGASPGCAGCEVTAVGSFYDPCTNEWQVQQLPLGKGFRLDDGTIQRIGDRVVALTLAVRRNPALDPESDYTLLNSEARGVLFDLRRQKLSIIRRHEHEWRSGQDVIDGFWDANGRYVVYAQKPRGSGARVFVYDVTRGRWAGDFKAPPELGKLLRTSGSDLWFELASSARHLVFSPANGSTRSVGGAPPVSIAAADERSRLDVRNNRGRWYGTITMPFKRAGQDYELRLRVRTEPGRDSCEGVERRPCDPVVTPPITRLEAAIHQATRQPDTGPR